MFLAFRAKEPVHKTVPALAIAILAVALDRLQEWCKQCLVKCKQPALALVVVEKGIVHWGGEGQ
jgi:hypothetical protein